MKRVSCSSALALLFSSAIPFAAPDLFIYASAQAEPGQKLPDWVASSCCGPKDIHRLTMANVQEVDAATAHSLRPASSLQMSEKKNYYVIDGYGDPVDSASYSVNPSGVSSQDQYVWAFYADFPAGPSCAPEGGCSGSHAAYQSGMYCLFLPESF